MKQLFGGIKRTTGESVEHGMRICSTVSTVLWLGSLFSVVQPHVLTALLGVIVTGAIVYGIVTVAVVLFRKLFREWTVWGIHLAILTAELTAILYQPHIKQGIFLQSLLVSVAAAVVTLAFAGTLSYQMHQHKKSLKLGILLMVSMIGTLVAFVFLVGDGSDSHWQSSYQTKQVEWRKNTRKTSVLKENEKQSFMKTVADGTMSTGMLTYGTESSANLKSITTDLSPFVNGYTGMTKMLRDWEDGYSLKETPLRGNIYFPQKEKNCPVLFLIHGQHERWEKSYQGYEYLGKYLASHGYVLVTVDENALNSGLLEEVTQENDARAILLLENIKQVLSYNRDPSTPLYQKINADKIVLAGHSRGGEAITDAALFSQQSHYPGNGNRLLPYRFSIQGLLAIAPTEGQYRPADHEVTLKNMNYLVLQGVEDQDVNTFAGLEAYKNITFHGRKTAFKSALFIGGANHGQFNSLWGNTDTLQPFALGLNTVQLMSKSDQQEILKIFTKIFMDVTLRGDTRFESLFWDYTAYQDALPQTVYSQQYENNTYENIADFEEDSNLITGEKEGILSGTTLLAEHTTLWGEEMYRSAENDYPQVFNNHVLHLKWQKPKKNPVYSCKFSQYDATGQYLQFDISERQQEIGVCSKALQTAEVIFTDIDGHETALPLMAYAFVQSPYPVESSKIQSLWNMPTYKYSIQTVRIPISDVRVKGGEAVRSKGSTDVRHLVKISLRFEKGTVGDIEVDNIGFSK